MEPPTSITRLTGPEVGVDKKNAQDPQAKSGGHVAS